MVTCESKPFINGRYPHICKKVTYTSGRMRLTGYKAGLNEEASCKRPGVLVAHTAIGPHDPLILCAINDLAALGYIVFALDMYGVDECARGEIKARVEKPYKEDRCLIAKHASTALQLLKDMEEVDETRVAAIGYCFGGKIVLDLARTGADLKLVVAFHGLLDRMKGPLSRAGNAADGNEVVVKPYIVAFHGYTDPYTPPRNLNQFMQELEEMKADYEVRVCGSGLLHGFMRPGKRVNCQGDDRIKARNEYHPRVASMAWDATLELLRKHLGEQPAAESPAESPAELPAEQLGEQPEELSADEPEEELPGNRHFNEAR